MKDSWDIGELRDHIRNSGNVEALATLNSVDRAVQIFSYHLYTARDALKGIVDESDPSGIHNLAFVLGGSTRQEEYAHAKIVSEANITGSIHAARSLFDIFSHLVNDLLLGHSIPVHVCDITKVHQAMPQSELKGQIGELLASDWYLYVVGFVNTTKHRKLVPHKFSVCFESDVAGVQLGSFEYRGRDFPSYWGTEVLQGVLQVKNSLVACGRELNHACPPASDYLSPR